MMIPRYNWQTMTLTTSRTTTQDLTTSSGQQSKMNMDYHITQSFNQSRLDHQSRRCEMEHAARPVANERNRSHTSASLTPRVKTTWEKNRELVLGINIIEQINAHIQTDDNDNEARIASLYRMLTGHDSEILSVPTRWRREQ